MHRTATRKQSLAVRYVMSLCCHVAKIIIVLQSLSQKKNMTEAMSMVKSSSFWVFSSFFTIPIKTRNRRNENMTDARATICFILAMALSCLE